jgi:hypothetical protein
MTVEEMRDRMTNAEYVRWSAFFARKAQRQQIAGGK